ncbi:restriction endonuclease subunit S [Luteitalea sp.]|uniref:restriction endonuclease subunit S n=1 Tax=Luteitalea sp. TaxID=2004800 RepID=UPI0025B8B94E|nr:restriction endonuclease subunit S [Luteitalea sp.]
MPIKRLREVLGRERRAFQPREGETYRLLGVRLYGEGCHIHSEVPGSTLKAPSLTRLCSGDLVYNKMWASKGSFAIVGDAQDGASATTEYPVFRPSNGANTNYLRYVLQEPRFWGLAKAWSSGSTDRQRLDPHDFLTMPVPLPSPEEQANIAGVLDSIDLTAQATRIHIEHLARTKHAVMRTLLTKGLAPHKTQLVPLPESWPMGRIVSTVDRMPSHWKLVTMTKVAKLESGHTPSRQHPEYWNGKIPWLSLGDTTELKKLRVEQTSECVTQAGIDNSSARLLPADTVVLSRTAVRGLCSRLAKPMSTSQDFAAFVCGPEVLPAYLVQLFRHMQREWRRLEQGSSPTNKTLYFSVFKGLKILLPPPKEQAAIAEVGESFDERVATETRYLEQLRESKRGLAQALLSGRLRVGAAKGARASGATGRR